MYEEASNISFDWGYQWEGASFWTRFLPSNAQIEHLFWEDFFSGGHRHFENGRTRTGRDSASSHSSSAKVGITPEQSGEDKVGEGNSGVEEAQTGVDSAEGFMEGEVREAPLPFPVERRFCEDADGRLASLV